MSIPLSETPTVGLGQFIKEVRFDVPSHQRDYSWKEEYVKQFLDDIENSLKGKEILYFCGLMVFTKTESPAFHVLDGQQRLATTLIIFSSIRNWLSGYSAFKKAQTQIEERYLGDSPLGKTDIDPKLTLNAANSDVFRRFVIDSIPLADMQKALRACKKADRNRTLLEATVYLNQRIRDTADQFESPERASEYLLSIVNYITDTVQIVRLIVRGDEAAYTIFETLNDRGMDLAPLDLVKNYLFSRAEKTKRGLRELEERWTEMMVLLSSVKADSFLRAFWASKHGTPEGARLFGPFKKEYAEPESAYAVSLDLRSNAELFVAVQDSNDSFWSSYSVKARDSIKALTIMGSSQFYPVMMAAALKFSPTELERLMRMLEVIVVRHQLVGRGRPGRIESLGGKTAKAISDKKITSASQAFSELRELYTSDDTFKVDFAQKTGRESKKAVYLLTGLEHQSLVRAQDQHSRETEPANVTLEHVLPKSIGSGWAQQIERDPDLHSDCLYMLGNMCLLSDANRALGNKAFSDKKDVLQKSKLRMTNSIAQFDDWNRASIEKRQQWMADLAAAEWRFQ